MQNVRSKKENDLLFSPKVTCGEAVMVYGLSKANFTIRFHLKLDQPIDPEKMRIAMDKTAARYPYFCVSLKKNDSEYYYEKNDAPIALLPTRGMVTLNSEETNGHIWAVCYDGDSLFIPFYHGRTDGTGVYNLLATLLYYYLGQQHEITDAAGIRTLEKPVTEAEVHDPVDDLPFIDLRKHQPSPRKVPLMPMEALGLQRMPGKGIIQKIIIPEEAFIPFSKENDASPGIMVFALLARAIRRVLPDFPEPVIGSYVANARPMLHANESFHNCVNTTVLTFDKRVEGMPLDRQCTMFRGMTFLQTDEDNIRKLMTVTGSASRMIFAIPDLEAKSQAALSFFRGRMQNSCIVSYVGKWMYKQLAPYIREFWLETSAALSPVIEVSAVNGNIFLSFMQSFTDKAYYNAFITELKEQGIPFTECGTDPVLIPNITM